MNKVTPQFKPRFKVKQFESQKWRRSAEGKTCELRLDGCKGDHGVVLAHLRFFAWAGIAQKPHDFLGVYACSHCHDALDNRNNTSWGFENVLRALGATLSKHYEEGRIK